MSDDCCLLKFLQCRVDGPWIMINIIGLHSGQKCIVTATKPLICTPNFAKYLKHSFSTNTPPLNCTQFPLILELKQTKEQGIKAF